MRTVALSLVMVIGSGSLLAAPSADEAKAILEKAIKAHGGADKLAKLDRVRIKAKGKGDFPGVGQTEFTIEDLWQNPDQYKTSVDMTVGGMNITIVQCVNGKSGWQKLGDMAMDFPAAELEEFTEQAYAERLEGLQFYKKDGYTLETLPEIKIGDKPAVGVKVSTKGHRDVKLYFDKDSGLLVKRDHEVKDEGGKLTNQETLYSDFKEKDGLKFAHKIEVQRDGKKFLEADVSEVEFLDKKIDDKEFAKP